MTAARRGRVAALVLAIAACTPGADGGDATVQAPSPAGDTLPPALRPPVYDDSLTTGPLFPFADSVDVGRGERVARSWGLRDAAGRIVVPASWYYATPMSGGHAAVAVADQWGRSRWGYVNAAGRVAIAPRYDGAGLFAAGRALVMLGDDFVVIDTMGTVLDRLAQPDAAEPPPTLPPACDECTLADYARRIPRVGEAVPLYVQPVVGESYRRIAVQRHPGDVVSSAEGGWEHWEYVLRVPGGTLEEGARIARRILGAGQFVERRDPAEPRTLVFEATGSRVGGAFEELRVRVRDGVLELSHAGGS